MGGRVDNARRAARRLPQDSYYELCHEKLVSAPERELTRLCGYLGEECRLRRMGYELHGAGRLTSRQRERAAGGRLS